MSDTRVTARLHAPDVSGNVGWPQGMWHGVSKCDMASVGVTWPQRVWNGLNGCGMV